VAVSGGKLFSGGLDLSFMTSLAPEDGSFFVLEVIQLYGRLLAFNCPTFCLVKGAAFAGGCMLAFCFD
jgi:enoyl-CoA hydratase/carnithine racemase